MASSGSSGAVVYVQGSQAPGAAVSAFLSKTSLSLEQLTFACATQAPPSAQFQAALVVTSADADLNSATLFSIASSLQPGALVYVTAQSASQVSTVQQALLLGGFLDAAPQAPSASGLVLVQAKKPAWERGAKAALTLKRPVAAPGSAPVSAAQAWKLSAANEDEDMVDEDELLTAEDKQSLPAVTASASDCSTSKKACKNCSCGRAEAEAAGEKVQLTQAMLDNPQTNCGSCALGDAFRCAGCPYRGLPAFEPGKKITLGSDLLTADA